MIIQDLDSNDLALQAIYEKPQNFLLKKFTSILLSSVFVAGVVGIVALFTTPSNLLIALFLGFVTGVTGAALYRQERSHENYLLIFSKTFELSTT